MAGGASSVSGLLPCVVTTWWRPAVITSVEGPGCAGGMVGSRLSCAMGRLPSPSSFICKSRSWFLVQYPAHWCWSWYHLSFINSTGICCAVLRSSTMYLLSWLSRDEIQRPSPSTSAGRLFLVLLCTSTHSPVLGISRRRAARVVKAQLMSRLHRAVGSGSGFQGLFQREPRWSVAC